MRVMGNSIVLDSPEEGSMWLNTPHEYRPCCNPEVKAALIKELNGAITEKGNPNG